LPKKLYICGSNVKVMQTQIEIDEKLLEEAEKYANVTDKSMLFRIVLTEYVLAHRKKDLTDLKGKIFFSENYDYKEMRKNLK